MENGNSEVASPCASQAAMFDFIQQIDQDELIGFGAAHPVWHLLTALSDG